MASWVLYGHCGLWHREFWEWAQKHGMGMAWCLATMLAEASPCSDANSVPATSTLKHVPMGKLFSPAAVASICICICGLYFPIF